MLQNIRFETGVAALRKSGSLQTRKACRSEAMRRAITLIELLVVVAIIAILVGVLYPLFAKAQRSAQRTHCINNLHQLYGAMQTYVQDWNETYPYAYDADNCDSYRLSPCLRDVLGSHTATVDVFRCPTDTGETYPRGPIGFRHKTPAFFLDPYNKSSYNWPGVGCQFNEKPLGGKPLSVVKRPTAYALLWELRAWHAENRPDDNFFTSPSIYNVMYCDGHIARETVDTLYAHMQSTRS